MADAMKFFSNPETEAKFEAPLGVDKTISIPGKYMGKLSNIPPDVAQAMVDMEDNQVKLRKKPLSTATGDAK